MRMLCYRDWLLSACLSTLICNNASGQSPLQTGSVRGTVYLADTGKPAEGAIVSLLPPQDRQGPVIDPKTGEFVVKDQPQRGDFHAAVESDGSFQIEGVKPGSYFVLTYLPGYLSQDDYIYPGILSPELDPGARQPAFVQKLKLSPVEWST